MPTGTARIYAKARTKLAARDAKILPDTCRLIVEGDAHEGVPCKFSGGSGDVDGSSYRIKFAWGSPAIIGASVIVDAITGRPQLTMQLVEPIDSSTQLWQEWRAVAPVYGRVEVGL